MAPTEVHHLREASALLLEIIGVCRGGTICWLGRATTRLTFSYTASNLLLFWFPFVKFIPGSAFDLVENIVSFLLQIHMYCISKCYKRLHSISKFILIPPLGGMFKMSALLSIRWVVHQHWGVTRRKWSYQICCSWFGCKGALGGGGAQTTEQL